MRFTVIDIRLAAAVGALIFLSSSYGSSSSVKILAATTGLLVLLPWLLTRQNLTLSPITLMGVLLGLASVVGSGGLSRLALMSLAVLLPSGLIAGSYLAYSGIARVVASGSIAATQWIPIVAQYRNPYLIVERLSERSFEAGFGGIPFAQVSRLRPVGTTVSPGLVAFLLVVGIVLATIPGVVSKGQRIAIWCLAAGHACCLVLTGSRTGIASLAIILAWSCGRSQRWGASLRAASIIAGSLAITILSESSARVAPETRFDIIRAAMPAFREHWLLGVGWGRTPDYVSTVADGIVYHLHFLPLHVLFELGLCGALGLVLLAIQLARRSRLAIAILVPFAIADAGVFINATTIFFLGVIIVLASVRTRVPVAAREPLPVL